MIGGVACWDRDVPDVEGMVRGMATRTSPDTPVVSANGPVAFFAAAGGVLGESGGDLWAVADLDVLNLDELRRLAGAEGVGWLGILYSREGPSFVRRLRGAFALALWDARERVLILAVDHVGMKRLYYASDGRRTAFASRPSALRALPGPSPSSGLDVDAASVFNYLNFGFVPGPASIFSGVNRLSPGCHAVVRRGSPTIERYWDLEYREAPARTANSAATVYTLVKEAVARALGDEPGKEVGTFLSGGTDSSTVLGLMGQVSGERVNAFSIGFHENPYNELAYADLAATHFEAAHFKRIVTAEDALDLLPGLVRAYDEPFGNASAIGTVACAQLAREHGVTRLLAGDGGDEIFGGNERYRTNEIFARYHRIPRLVRRGLIEPIVSGVPQGAGGVLGRVARYVYRANLPNPERFYVHESFFARHAADWLSPEFRAAVPPDAPYRLARGLYEQVTAASELNRLLYLDMKLTIGDNDLLKVTRTAEVAGLEVRFPLLDVPLMEFMGTLPADFKVRGLEKRYLFRRAFSDLLPPAILAKRKHGFGVPISMWLRGHPRFRELARDTLGSVAACQRGYFQPGAFERLFALNAADATPYYGDILWVVLMLEWWHRCHLDGAHTP